MFSAVFATLTPSATAVFNVVLQFRVWSWGG